MNFGSGFLIGTNIENLSITNVEFSNIFAIQYENSWEISGSILNLAGNYSIVNLQNNKFENIFAFKNLIQLKFEHSYIELIENTFSACASESLLYINIYQASSWVNIASFSIENSLFKGNVIDINPFNFVNGGSYNLYNSKSKNSWFSTFIEIQNATNLIIDTITLQHFNSSLTLENTVLYDWNSWPDFTRFVDSEWLNIELTSIIDGYNINSASISNINIDQDSSIDSNLSNMFALVILESIKDQAILTDIAIQEVSYLSNSSLFLLRNIFLLIIDNISISSINNSLAGGLIEIFYVDSVFLTNITFGNIYSSSFVGILCKGSKNIKIESCSFNSINSQNTIEGLSIWDLANSGTVEIENCKFFNFNPGTDGDVIFIYDSDNSYNTTYYISDCSFEYNLFLSYVINAYKSQSHLLNNIYLSNCIFSNNINTAINIYNMNLYDENSNFSQSKNLFVGDGTEAIYSFSGSKFDGNFGSDTATIIAFKGSLQFNNCQFTNHYFTIVSIQDEASLTLKNCTFSQNMLLENTALVSIVDCVYPSQIIDSKIISNVYSSMLIEIANSNVTIENSIFEFNQGARNDSARIYMYQDANVTVLNTSFYSASNTVEIYSSWCTLLVIDCEFDNESGISLDVVIDINGGYYFYFFNSKISNSFSGSSLRIVDGWNITIKDSHFISSHSIGVKIEKSTFLSIEKSTFNGGQAISANVVVLIEIIESNFTESYSSNSGGAMSIRNSDHLFANTQQGLIKGCYFKNNTSGKSGGAIFLDEVEFAIENSTFIGNTATAGGAIYLICEFYQECYSIQNTDFRFNNAFDFGGAVSWLGYYQNLTNSNNTFYSNDAPYGQDEARHPSKPVSIVQRLNNYSNKHGNIFINYTMENSTIIIDNVRPSTNFIVGVSLALVDSELEIVDYGFDKYYTLVSLSSGHGDLLGVKEKHPITGITTLDELFLKCEPSQEYILSVTYIGYDYDRYSTLGDIIQLNTSIVIKTRNCTTGEYLASESKSCVFCEEGWYSLNTSDIQCTKCPLNAYCYGGDKIVPIPGYWRLNIEKEIIECLIPDNCLGGLKYNKSEDSMSLTGRCQTGYKGNLCQACEVGYSSTDNFACEKCIDDTKNITRLLGILLLLAITLVVLVRMSLKSAYQPTSVFSVYLKIFINHIQMISLIARIKLNWPTFVNEYLSFEIFMGQVATQMFSIDCLLMDKNDPESDKNVYFNKLIVIALLPLLLGILALIFWSFIAVIKGSFNIMKHEFIGTLCILLFLIWPNIAEKYFSIFNCKDIYGDKYLMQNLDIKCWDSPHSFYAFFVALPAILIWIIAAPLCVFLFLRKRLWKRHTMHMKLRFGFLYNGYKENHYYWEFVVLLRKFLIVCITVFLNSESPTLQAVGCFTILLIFTLLQYKYNPFKHDDFNNAELSNISVALITIYCGFYYMSNILTLGGEIFFFIFILLANLCFAIYLPIHSKIVFLLEILLIYILYLSLLKFVNYIN